jgi:hypothetical protein
MPSRSSVVIVAAVLFATSCSWTSAACDEALQSLVDAKCSDKNTWANLKAESCSKIASPMSRLCDESLAKAAECQAAFMSHGGISCVPFYNYTQTTDACAQDILAAAMCVRAVNNTECSMISCRYDGDCSKDSKCNDVTQRCFRTGAHCEGLPCRYASDCSDGTKCNSETKLCQRNDL